MKSRIFMSMLVIALAAALVGGATMSLFTDVKETEDFQYTAGTVIITPSELTHVIDFGSIGNMAPGDKVYGSFTVENEGSLDIWFTVEAFTDGYLFEDGSFAAQVNINSPQVILGQGEEATVFFDVYLPREAGNDYQDQEGALKFGINAEQAAHNPPPWEPLMDHSLSVNIDGGQYYPSEDRYYVELSLKNAVIGDLEEFAIALYKDDKLLQKNIATSKLFEDFPNNTAIGSSFKATGVDQYYYKNFVGNTEPDGWLGDQEDVPNKIVVTAKSKWGVDYTWSLDFTAWDSL
ncbi:MAG: TasA family protein [bacterium]